MKEFFGDIIINLSRAINNCTVFDIIFIVLLVFIFFGVSDSLNGIKHIIKLLNRMSKSDKSFGKNIMPEISDVQKFDNKYEPIEITIKKNNKKLDIKINYSEVPYCIFNETKLWSVDQIIEYGKNDCVKYSMKNTNIKGLEGSVTDVAAVFNNQNLSNLIDKYGVNIMQ